METVIIVVGGIILFLGIIALIIAFILKKFLRFTSISDFEKLGVYLKEKHLDLVDSNIVEQLTATYIYNNTEVFLQAIIFSTNRAANNYYNKYDPGDGTAMFVAKCFSIGKNTTRARLFKKTFLLVKGLTGSNFKSFYKLVLSCLSAS